MAAKSTALKRIEFGNPILRQKARRLTGAEIASKKTQRLIKDMQTTLTKFKLGVGLAAPQIGESIAVSVISFQPTKHRPDMTPFDLVVINPEVVQTYGRKKQLWEGCISGGAGKAGLFAKVPRYKKVRVKYFDEKAVQHVEEFEGLQAHVLQHEIDHLNGILFVDLVKDTTSYTTYSEYLKLQKQASAE
jgi:peptide deformylase